MAELSDKDLIKKIKNGKIDHYSYIVKKYTTLIYKFIERKLFKKEETDDLVQNDQSSHIYFRSFKTN